MGTVFPEYPSQGEFDIKLPAGLYKYEIDRGAEYHLAQGSFEVKDSSLTIGVELKRLIDMKRLNWWSGEVHIHRKPQHIRQLMRASDIHIAAVITSWNDKYNYANEDSAYDYSPRKFDENRFYALGGSEDERAGGALLVLNTPEPVDFSKHKQPEYPALAQVIKNVRGKYGHKAWIDVEKPFWWDFPVLLATGEINSVGIAHNHMNQAGVFDNEGLGRPRDKSQYQSPGGNGLYTQDIYYHMLNCGLRVPPSAGSASGVLMNPVGYNRIYGYVENGLSYEKWFDAVRAGKSFVTNGPLLICRANNYLPGHVFKAKDGDRINVDMEIYSRDTIETIEIIKNGRICKRLSSESLVDNKASANIFFDKGGWFLVRVICKTSGNFRFASTASFFVDSRSKKRFISKKSAEFFLEWINERAGKIKIENTAHHNEAMKQVEIAKRFWEHKLASATSD